MIKQKNKLCIICGFEKPIWSRKRCKPCAMKQDNFIKTQTVTKALKKKEKAESRPSLEKKLDDVFSKFIRLRNVDDNGMVKCFTCTSIAHWKDMDCGHYWSRRYKSTRWDETNCQVQCTACNIFNQGAGPQFSANIGRKYGEGMLQMLEIKKNNTSHLGTFELKTLIGIYVDKVASLTK